MKTVKLKTNVSAHARELDIPETWDEAYSMLKKAAGRSVRARGDNVRRNSVSQAVAYGMFGKEFIVDDTSLTLNFLLQKICKLKGEGRLGEL